MQRTKLKILYVSDSLGTPIHPRGIFNYSVSVLEIMRSLGMEVTLVAEGAPGYGLPDRSGPRRVASLAPKAVEAMRLAEVHRYFDESLFSYQFEYGSRLLRLLLKRAPRLLRLWHRVERQYGAASCTISADPSQLAWGSAKTEHLGLADRLCVVDRVYSASMTQAVNRTAVVTLDAAGYDIVMVDTPHYVAIRGVPHERIVAVIHDLIPLEEWIGVWRTLFEEKVNATLRFAGNLVFVSEATRDTFRRFFPHHDQVPDTILYPAIRSGLLAAAQAENAPRTDYMAGIGARRRTQWLEREAKLLPESLPTAVALGQVSRAEIGTILDPGPAWDPQLPFFATVVSDEPRKNIGIFVAAAEALRGRANLVVVGQVDADRHVRGAPERYPNLHFTGYVTEAEKLDLIRGSAGLVFASFSEGFGIPVVEGAVFGRPVICADIPVFREITGGLATYIDPNRPEDLVRAILDILANPAAADVGAKALRSLCIERYNQDAMAERLGQTLARMVSRPVVRSAA